MKLPATLALAFLATVAFAADDDKDFKPLFNGKDTAGWHVRNEKAHNGWTVQEGVLKNDLKPGEHGVDLVTDAKFWNFTVRYEYMVPDGSNSGFYLRGRHELQILGDFKAGKASPGGNGAIYQHTPASQFVSRPGDAWQTCEATMIGSKITVTLNGVKIHDNVVCERATGSELDGKVTEPGAFFLQGDHGTVSFRNIRVKELAKDIATTKPATPAPATPDPKIVEKSQPLEAVLDKALAAYNGGDAAAFGAGFSKAAIPPASAEIFQTIYEDIYKADLGGFVSRKLNWRETTPDADHALLVCDAKFEKAPNVKVSANFTRDGGALKIVQLRFEKSDVK